MAKLAETYSLSTGLKIGKPFINTSFFPVRGTGNYIVFHNSSGNEAKNYPYFQEVVDIIQPYLKERGIDIIQLGTPNDKKIFGAYNYCGATDIRQSAFLISRAKLVVGNDSMLVHMAGGLDVPVVAIYGPTTADCHGPYWHTKNSIFLQTDRKGKNPLYSFHDPSIIKNLNPEVVVNAIFKILGIKSENNVQSLYFGKRYNDLILESIPNCIVPKEIIPNAVLNIRNDYFNSQEVIYQQIQIRKCSIVTKTPLDVRVLSMFRDNVLQVFYEITDNHNPEFVKALKSAGIHYELFTYLDEETINKYKLDYMEYGLINVDKKTKISDLNEVESQIQPKTLFKTNKKILSKGKIYLSKAHEALDLPVSDLQQREQEIVNAPMFWEELDYLYIFNKK